MVLLQKDHALPPMITKELLRQNLQYRIQGGGGKGAMPPPGL